MGEPDRLRTTLRTLLADRSKAGSVLVRLCVGATTLLPVAGATISVTAAPAGLSMVAASDQAVGRLDQQQFVLGEGPSCDTARDGHPNLVGDLDGSAARRWPVFSAAVVDAGFRSVYALPLEIGAIRLGVLALFGSAPSALDRDRLADAFVVADVAALALVERPADGRPDGGDGNGYGSIPVVPSTAARMRAEVHQATGMVMVQLGVDAQQALVRLRAYAYSRGQSADDVAREIVARRLRLEPDAPR